MSELSARVGAIEPSRTIAMNQRARELRESGVDVVDLSVGEPDFPTPLPVREAAKRAVDEGHSRYTPVAGYRELREAVSRKLCRENGLDYEASCVMASCGAKHCLANAILALVDPGDEVIIPSPRWVSYAELVRLAGGVPIPVETKSEEGYKLSPAALEAAAGPRTKLLILCTPSNPTGAVYSAFELTALAEAMARYPRIWMLSDEVYEHIDYTGRPHASPASIAAIRERTVIVNGVSKAYAMTGWRIGYLAGPENLVKACIDLQGQMTTNATAVAQRAAIAALDSGTALIGGMIEAFLARRELVVSGLGAIEGVRVLPPEGAFYVFPDMSRFYGMAAKAGAARGGGIGSGKPIRGSDDLADYLLEAARVAVVPGSAFGDDRCIRVSFATGEDRLREGIERIGAALEGLR